MIRDTGRFTDSEMFKESARLKSFDKWTVPFISERYLACCCFYYLYIDDSVRCAFCGVLLWDWRPQMTRSCVMSTCLGTADSCGGSIHEMFLWSLRAYRLYPYSSISDMVCIAEKHGLLDSLMRE
jgi:hypothetical protein